MTRKVFCLALVLSLPLVFSSIPRGQAQSLPPGASSVDSDHAAARANPLAAIENDIGNRSYSKAAGLLDAYIAAHPTNARALFDRGFCADAQGQTAQAALFYRKAIA